MIPSIEPRVAESSPVAASSSFGISRGDEAHLMTVLRDTLYSDKIMAVLREYSANAWDAHREAGKDDVPIRVTLPTLESPELEIKDFGPGLSREDVFGVFAMYGASTKRIDNKTVGMLGIGSKSGFAYADSFVIESRHGGSRSTYVAVLDSSERGEIRLLDEAPCGDDSGLTIRIAARPRDIGDFRQRAAGLYAHFSPRPEINLALPEPIEWQGLGALRDEIGWTAVMGCVPYRVDLSQLRVPDCARNLGGALRFEIGELDVSASRESLKYSDRTRAALQSRVEAFIDECATRILDEVDRAETPWQKRIVSQKLRRFGWTTEPDEVELPEFSATRVSVREGRKRLRPKAIAADSRTRVVIRDDKRAISGFSLGPRDYVASTSRGSNLAQMEFELALFLNASCKGIPVERTSRMPWTAPPRKAIARRSAVPSGRLFVLKPASHYWQPYSQWWMPADRLPAVGDVCTEIRGFVGDAGNDRFFNQLDGDRDLLELAGEAMPAVFGWKRGRDGFAKKYAGKDFAAWHDELPRRLLRLPRVKELVAQLPFARDSAPSEARVVEIEAKLGEKHPIARLCRRILDASALSYKTRNAAQRLASTADKPATLGVGFDALDGWPLLKAEGIEKLWGKDADAWLDYAATKRKRKSK